MRKSIVLLIALLFSSLSYSYSDVIKDFSISLSGSDRGQIFSNGNNQIEIFVNVDLDEGEEIEWIKLIRKQDKKDIQELGWLYRSPLGQSDEYYSIHGKYALPNAFIKTTQGNPFAQSRELRSKADQSIQYNSKALQSIEYNYETLPLTVTHSQTLYLSSDVVQTVDICAEVTLKSGVIDTSCEYSEPTITVSSITPSVIPSNQFSSSDLIDADDIEEVNNLQHFSSLKAILAPNALEGFIHAIYIDSPDEEPLLIYDEYKVNFAGEKTTAYWIDNETYHFALPNLNNFKYLTLGRKLELNLKSVSSKINTLTRGFTHILNVVTIPYNMQGSTYDTIWVVDGGVYNNTYGGCYFPPERNFLQANSTNCSKKLSESILDKIKNRDQEIVILDKWGTQHRFKISDVI
ncbi:hypothetical protein [Vibrio navarrensis]|uniref:hypothetical protein n=1 Tax=Vibrio navarrensis TaxID=29495 RepID=UPI001869B194|nr:hypothetical protein [Vibrio navarrensis]MBE4605675.1 hypothetical protein [Vibrio navarrensis]